MAEAFTWNVNDTVEILFLFIVPILVLANILNIAMKIMI